MSISLCGLLRVTLRSDPQFLYTDLQATICPLVCIRGTAGGEGKFIDIEYFAQKYMRRW